MNLKLTALIPWMVLAGTAHAQIREAEVLYTFRDGAAQSAYRLGDECFVPLDTLSSWGWIVDRKADSVNLSLDGRTVHMDLRSIAGKYAVALRKAVQQLGGQSSWTQGADTLNVYSPLSSVTVKDMKVHAAGGLAFRSVPSFFSPASEVIDFVGCRLTDSTQQDLPKGATLVQYRPNTVRLTVQTGFVPKAVEKAIPESATFDFQLSKDQELTDKEQQLNTPGSGDIVPKSSQATPEVMSVEILKDEDAAASVRIRLPNPLGGQVSLNKTDPLTLELVLPVQAELPTSNFYLSTRTISSVVATLNPPNTLLTFHLNRPMVSEVINERNGVTINLLPPSRTSGHLAGKLVVVDPGHGGHDRGAHVGDVNEKDLNLPIGKKLAADLQAAGATVIITRSDDTFIPLVERASIANRNHADLFISCHINSTGGSPTQSGTITFYHRTNQICMYLAQCIQHEVAKVNGLPDLGVWSDTKIYPSGFSVLRNTTCPAVLIEMGFINHPKDRVRMLTSDFQDKVAAAVVRGARVFFGETNPNE